LFATLVLASWLTVSAMASAKSDTKATAAPAASATAAIPTDTDLASTRCVIGEEKFLPADYYYCIGQQTYGQQHYDYAKKFFNEAAGWGSKPAQYVLGIMALNGDHQPMNRPLALAWFALAAERPQSPFKAAYATALASATPAEREASDRLLSKMRPTYADATAAVRGEKRYAEAMAELNRKDPAGGNYCLEGMNTQAQTTADPTSCPPVQIVVQQIDKAAVNVFDGWSGHVTVGPLQQVDRAAVVKKNGG
jgi:hypothetical protein